MSATRKQPFTRTLIFRPTDNSGTFVFLLIAQILLTFGIADKIILLLFKFISR
jgi:hypothetical protein